MSTILSNLQDINAIGDAVMANGDFLTYDGLPNNRFSLIIPKLPNVQFFLQTFTLPDISITQVKIPTRYVDYNEIGEKVEFSPFNVTFMVDKYCRNWSSVYNWMKEITVSGSNVGNSTDCVLMIDGKETIRFYGAWPTSLSGFSFDRSEERRVGKECRL